LQISKDDERCVYIRKYRFFGVLQLVIWLFWRVSKFIFKFKCSSGQRIGSIGSIVPLVLWKQKYLDDFLKNHRFSNDIRLSAIMYLLSNTTQSFASVN